MRKAIDLWHPEQETFPKVIRRRDIILQISKELLSSCKKTLFFSRGNFLEEFLNGNKLQTVFLVHNGIVQETRAVLLAEKVASKNIWPLRGN